MLSSRRLLTSCIGCLTKLYVEPTLEVPTDGADITTINDYSGKNRDLVPITGTKPKFYNNVLNTRSMMRFTGASVPLANSANTFEVSCGWIVAKYNGSNFDDYRGLLTGVDADNQPGDVLVSNNTGSAFFYFGDEFFEFRKNDSIFPATAAPAPMNQFAVIFFRYWKPTTLVGVQIGQQRQFTTRRWNGDVGLVALFSRGFCESDIRANTKIIADYYALALADVFPYQADKRGSIFSSITLESLYDPPEGMRISEVLDKGTFEGDLNFSNRKKAELKAFELYHKNHYPEVPFIYRNYKYLPPVDFEGYFNSDYEFDGENNNFKYGFKFKGKKVE